MTVIVTSNVSGRFRGFLASCMLEIAPGVYTQPSMTKGVRDRIWIALSEWFNFDPSGSIVMTWKDKTLPGRQGVETLGIPKKVLFDHDGVLLVKKELMSLEATPPESMEDSPKLKLIT